MRKIWYLKERVVMATFLKIETLPPSDSCASFIVSWRESNGRCRCRVVLGNALDDSGNDLIVGATIEITELVWHLLGLPVLRSDVVDISLQTPPPP